MTKILLIANYTKSKGGISIQVDTLYKKINESNNIAYIFKTKKNNLKRVFLPILLFSKGIKYEIFHVHGCSYSGFYPIVIGTIIGKLLNKRIIITYHGGGLKKFIESYPKLVKWIFSLANQITVPSEYLLKVLIENKVKAILLPNIIKEDNVIFKKRTNISPILITTRSLEPVYNIPLAIHAFQELQLKYPKAKLFIVGNGSLSYTLENEVKKKNLKNIEFLGAIENSKIGLTLNKADIYINPTTADNMPLSLFEAFACGLPVISTNVGGIPNFIQDSENGFLIDSNDKTALVEKIEYILLNQDKIKPIIKKGFQTFEKFTWNQLKLKYINLYN